MRIADHVRINGEVFAYQDKAPFVPSGQSTLGALECDIASDKLKCHECGEWFAHLGAHVAQAHQMPARAYKSKHGLKRRTPLIAASIKQKLHTSGLTQAANVLAVGARTRISRGCGIRTKKGAQHEKRNLRGSCQAQTLESIERLARYLKRTPVQKEAQEAGINISSAEALFGLKWSEIISSMGLVPIKAGVRRSLLDERMEWPPDYFRVRAEDLKARSSLA